MLSSELLYDGLDRETAELQLILFTKKKAKAFALIEKLKPSFNLMAFTQGQRDLEWRIDKIKKAILFCEEQCEEAQEVLNGTHNDDAHRRAK